MRANGVFVGWVLGAAGLAVVSGAEGDGRPPMPGVEALVELVKPAAGESPWREVAWLTDVTAARQRAVEEDKPLVIFTAADGSPLGRT